MATIDITPDFQLQRGVGVTATHLVSVVDLDGASYRIEYKTNKRDNSWYLDLFDANGAPLVLGVGVACGVDLLWPYRARAVPPGVLFCSPHTGALFTDPVLDSFVRGTHTILYLEAGGA